MLPLRERICTITDDMEELIRQADSAMYAAKNNGGHQLKRYEHVANE
ncbi:hypothetical protein [Bacillus fonticola]|nr:hypothetical protein [Bacillus fonticola]